MDTNRITIAERNDKLKHLITCLKCEISGKCCDDNCPTQYDAGNLGDIVENLDAISKILEQEPRKITYEDVKGYCESRCLTIIDNEVLYKLTHPKNNEIEQFVEFLIKENCDGCVECEPRVSTTWKPKFACVEEGRTKWFLHMAEKWKAEKGGRI